MRFFWFLCLLWTTTSSVVAMTNAPGVVERFVTYPPTSALNLLRNKIDRVDDALYYLLTLRIMLTNETRIYKRRVGCPEREKQILDRLHVSGGNRLSRDMINEVWNVIFRHSRDAQYKYRWLE